MKHAATRALAALAREEVVDEVREAYGGETFSFGPDYIIPKPFDPRALLRVAPQVARAAMESGVAQAPIADWAAYDRELEERLNVIRARAR